MEEEAGGKAQARLRTKEAIKFQDNFSSDSAFSGNTPRFGSAVLRPVGERAKDRSWPRETTPPLAPNLFYLNRPLTSAACITGELC